MKIELRENLKKIQEFNSEIQILTNTKEGLINALKEKDVKIEEMVEEIRKVKAEVLECKKNSNFIPQNCGDLYLENQELKEKIKEIEHEHYLYTQHMIEALELLKLQLQKEQLENSGLKSIIDSPTEEEYTTALENEKNKIRELQEELRIVKKKIELVRENKDEQSNFEPLSTENRDDPEGVPCKCIIY